MTVDEQELVLVLNRADAAEGFILASSTWPRWTRFLDKLVAAGLATVEDIRDREGRRTGGNYKINPGAIRIGRRIARGAIGFRQDRAVVLDGHLVVADLIATVNRRRSVFPATLDPLDGRVQAHREMRAEHLLRVHLDLRAESATNFGRDDPHPVFGHANQTGQERPQQMRNLRRRPERQGTAAAIERRHAAARLDGHWRQALVVDALADDTVGVLERRFDLGELDIELPQICGVPPAQVRAQQIAAFASTSLAELFPIQSEGESRGALSGLVRIG